MDLIKDIQKRIFYLEMNLKVTKLSLDYYEEQNVEDETVKKVRKFYLQVERKLESQKELLKLLLEDSKKGNHEKL